MSVPETEALLNIESPVNVKSQVLHNPKDDLQRSWRYPWWRVVGNGSPEDIVALFMSLNIPLAFLAFAWNAHRTGQSTFWKELGKGAAMLLGAWLAWLLNQYLTVVALVIIATVYAAKRRQQLRQQFGISGTFYQDLLIWTLGAPCALAQETRTLVMNQVHDGMWCGPPTSYAECSPNTQHVV